MDFIRDNYVWFIVGGIIIIMAIIGYIADKTNFGRDKIEKEPKDKKEKVKNNKQPEKIEIEDKGIGDLTQSLSEANIGEANQINDLTQSLSEANIGETNQINVSEDLYAPLGGEPIAVEDSMEFVDQDLYQPLPDKVEAVMNDTDDIILEPTGENVIPEGTYNMDDNEIINDNSEPVVINEPDDSVSSEEDIWKF